MAKRKAKAKAKTRGTKAILNAALTAAENCCIALDMAYGEFSDFKVLNKRALKRARTAADKVFAQLELL